jgi:hypothetical protein
MGEHIRVSARVVERVRRDFSDPEVADVVIQLLEEWRNAWPGEGDRVQAAIVLYAVGDVDKFLAALETAYRDWRDVLMASGFADEDWKPRMDAEFGSE